MKIIIKNVLYQPFYKLIIKQKRILMHIKELIWGYFGAKVGLIKIIRG